MAQVFGVVVMNVNLKEFRLLFSVVFALLKKMTLCHFVRYYDLSDEIVFSNSIRGDTG
jgi:hypothetical protein